MRLRKHLALWMIGALLVIAGIAFRPAFTFSIPSPGIAALEQVTLGGTPQWILVRGHDLSRPIVLFLHGGPGMPSMFLAHAFQSDLEKDFVVVHWDRRGAGKSYAPDIDPQLMRVSQELSETEELIRLLLERFGPHQVILVGHSYGSYLGVEFAKRHPDLVAAYVGVGQTACGAVEQSTIQDEWLRGQALLWNDADTVTAIDRQTSWDRESALFMYGGEVVGMKSFVPIIMLGLRSPEYTLRDALNVPKGVQFTHKHLIYDVDAGLDQPLIDAVPSLSVPVYFFSGRHDMTTPSACAERFYANLESPSKHWVWFEHSAHFAFLEEPERFHEELTKVARDLQSLNAEPQ